MIDHVLTRFPDRRESIEAMLETDAAFQEVCADYEEICTWLAARDRTTRPSTEDCERAAEVVEELEEEIRQRLEEAGYSAAGPPNPHTKEIT